MVGFVYGVPSFFAALPEEKDDSSEGKVDGIYTKFKVIIKIGYIMKLPHLTIRAIPA
jgi:hypothetical protein